MRDWIISRYTKDVDWLIDWLLCVYKGALPLSLQKGSNTHKHTHFLSSIFPPSFVVAFYLVSPSFVQVRHKPL